MKIFKIFKEKFRNISGNKHNQLLAKMLEGPTFLEGFTVPIDKSEELLPFEWKRKLQSLSGGNRFRIRYYGDLYEGSQQLLTGTEFAPILVVAVDEGTGKEILLFDGCRHGYNAMFCDTYSRAQIEDRIPDKQYTDRNGNDVFEILLSAYYQLSEQEFSDMIDGNGNVKLLDGTIVRHDIARRNCYDLFRIFVINETGDTIEIVSEELA